jgi:hypothetical protein
MQLHRLQPFGSDVTSGGHFFINDHQWTPQRNKQDSPLKPAVPLSNPVDGTSYTAGNIFGSGSEIGTGNFVVYNGSDNSVTVTSLEACTTYHVAVYEFILSGGLPDYLLTDPGRGSQLIPGEAPESGDYRTVESGDWGTPGIWEFNNGTTWVGAASAPA